MVLRARLCGAAMKVLMHAFVPGFVAGALLASGLLHTIDGQTSLGLFYVATATAGIICVLVWPVRR